MKRLPFHQPTPPPWRSQAAHVFGSGGGGSRGSVGCARREAPSARSDTSASALRVGTSPLLPALFAARSTLRNATGGWLIRPSSIFDIFAVCAKTLKSFLECYEILRSIISDFRTQNLLLSSQFVLLGYAHRNRRASPPSASTLNPRSPSVRAARHGRGLLRGHRVDDALRGVLRRAQRQGARGEGQRAVPAQWSKWGGLRAVRGTVFSTDEGSVGRTVLK